MPVLIIANPWVSSHERGRIGRTRPTAVLQVQGKTEVKRQGKTMCESTPAGEFAAGVARPQCNVNPKLQNRRRDDLALRLCRIYKGRPISLAGIIDEDNRGGPKYPERSATEKIQSAQYS